MITGRPSAERGHTDLGWLDSYHTFSFGDYHHGDFMQFGTLRVINSSQLSYAVTCGAGFYAADFVTLGTAPAGSPEGFISGDMGSAVTVKKANYLFQMSGTPMPGSPASCNGVGMGGGAPAYRVGADALDPADGRFFATNASGVIYQASVSLYGTMPEAAPPVGGTPVQ